MNQRIKELYKQAMEQHVSNNMAWEELNPEKFAELIVKECVSVFWSEDCNTSDLALEEYNRNSKKIKEHFGVEE
jgi:hypothetical protein